MKEHTSPAQNDEIVSSLVRSFQDTFPNRIHSYYLIGSFAEQTVVTLSDLDALIIFKNSFSSLQEQKLAQRLIQKCAVSAHRRLDIVLTAEDQLAHLPPILQVALKLGSSLIMGDDIRPSLALPPHEDYSRFVSSAARQFIARLRGMTELNQLQVTYPDPHDEFFGYTQRRIAVWYPPHITAGTKELVATVSRITTAVIAQRLGCYVIGKQQAFQLYTTHIGGQWASFVTNIFHRCKLTWQYLIPETQEERAELRVLCAQMLGFENRFLESDEC